MTDRDGEEKRKKKKVERGGGALGRRCRGEGEKALRGCKGKA